MSQDLLNSVAVNYQDSAKMLAETIMQFTPEQWTKGFNYFQVPWKIAYHIIDCLDYYFRPQPEVEYQWGHRFGGGWWELPVDKIPAPETLVSYLYEIEERIEEHFSMLQDEALVTPYDAGREHGETRLEHYIYALRHTMHHHGALSQLSLCYGNPEGSWE